MLWNKLTTTNKGQCAEQLAAKFLRSNGLKVLTQNFHCRFGEIDIIAQDNNTIIFIEVKYRKQTSFGGAISAVPVSKQQKIIKSAQIYLQQAALNEYNTACRFDVIALQGSFSQPDINWLTNAF